MPALFYLNHFSLYPVQRQLLNKVLALRLASFGNAGVDIFLVLTGLWATWQLVPAMEAACVPKGSAAKTGKNSAWSTVKEYYRCIYSFLYIFQLI